MFNNKFNERTFIEDPALVAEMLEQLTPSEEPAGYNCKIFYNLDSGQKWERYVYDSEGEDQFGFRKLPYQ